MPQAFSNQIMQPAGTLSGCFDAVSNTAKRLIAAQNCENIEYSRRNIGAGKCRSERLRYTTKFYMRLRTEISYCGFDFL